MTLADFWFIVLAVLWTGFFLLEGFDFGVEPAPRRGRRGWITAPVAAG
jgi:hypothetical protein